MHRLAADLVAHVVTAVIGAARAGKALHLDAAVATAHSGRLAAGSQD